MDVEQLQIEEENLKKNRRLFRRYLIFFAVIFLIAGGYWMGFTRGQKQGLAEEKVFPLSETIIQNKFQGDNQSVDFSLFWKVWELLKEKYVNRASLDAQQMVYGAIKGMVKSTGDPYTTFFDPKETKSFAQDLEGSFDGIGAELGIKDEILTVIAPLEDSPSQKAGLRAGDKILKIGDKITSDMTIDEAVDLIRGKKGTEVKLTVLHEGDQETRDVTIVRDTIEVKSVKVEFRDPNVAHIKIIKFGEETTKEFDDAMNQVLAKGSEGIILDVRNNPGGFLDKSVDIASRLIPKGEVVVTEEDNTGKKESLYTKGGDRLNPIPIVVLINEGSASASEILAGALRDDRKITLIGKKSFGKGSVQELIDLPGNSSIKVTVAKWLTPNGDYIMEKGINPDVEVNMTLDDFNNQRDPQLDKALEVIKERMAEPLN
jgi:carboxyl-terminal processing protease